jgi:hypothetical protein
MGTPSLSKAGLKQKKLLKKEHLIEWSCLVLPNWSTQYPARKWYNKKKLLKKAHLIECSCLASPKEHTSFSA